MQSDSFDNCILYYNVEILNLFDPELQLINTKPVIKNKVKELLRELKKFKVQISKLTGSYSDIDEAFKFMHQSIMTKIKKYASEDCIVLDAIIKYIIKIFEC